MTGHRFEGVAEDLQYAAMQLEELFASLPKLTTKNLQRIRSGVPAAQLPADAEIPVDKHMVSPGEGVPDVPVYLINPGSRTRRPAILYLHGGGFAFGSAIDEIPRLSPIALELNCVVVAVDYRLAPEARWHDSLAENYAVLKWMHEYSGELGIDPSRLAIMGESAGGGHAALLAMEVRDRGEVPVVLQVLLYPMLDDRTGSSRRVRAPAGTIGWKEEHNRFGWRCFLGREPGRSSASAGGVPARAPDLSGLAPTYIAVGAIDLFLEENLLFASRLATAGVPVEVHVAPGAFHGFDRFAPQAGVSRQFARLMRNALRRAFSIDEADE